MSYIPIDTGYKPDGALGALYQGFNAADAQQMNELDIIKQYLANQREQNAQPLDLQMKQFEAAKSNTLNNPNFLNAFLQGQMGAQKSLEATGNLDSRTVDSKIARTNAENLLAKLQAGLKNKFVTQQEKELDALLSGQVPNDSVSTQPQTNIPPNSNIGFNFNKSDSNYSNEGRITNADIVVPIGNMTKESSMKNSMGTDHKGSTPYDLAELQKELSRKDLTPQAREILIDELDNVLARINSGQTPTWTPVNQENTIPSTTTSIEQTPISQPVSQQPVNLLTRMAKVLGTTPEHVNKLEELNVGAESRIQAAQIAAEARIEAAKKAAENSDTIKAKELQHSAKLYADALGYEKLINGQEIQAQKDALLRQIVNGDKKAAEDLNTLNNSINRWKALAEASRRKAQQIDKKYGYDSVDISSTIPTTSTPAVIKYDSKGNRINE